MRVVCYVTFPISAILFIVFSYYALLHNKMQEASTVKSAVLFVGVLSLYLSKVDRDYLIKSIPLRVLLCMSAASGVVAMFLIISKS